MWSARLRNELIAYFLLAFAITFVLSWVVAGSPAARPAVRTAASILLHYGPALAAIVVAGAAGGRRGIGRLLRPLGHWRVGVGWYVFVLLFPLGVRLAATGLNLLLGGSPPSFFAAGAESGVPAGVHPLLLLVPVFLGVFLQAGIAEEIGWRGFALPRLQARFGALTSSLILGLLWAVWHFDPQRGPALLERGVLYPLAVLAMTVLMTWVYNSTGGSLLLVVLYHTASNVSDWIAPTANLAGAQAVAGGRPFALQVGLMWLAAGAVIALYGPRDLASRSRVRQAEPTHTVRTE